MARPTDPDDKKEKGWGTDEDPLEPAAAGDSPEAAEATDDPADENDEDVW